MIEQKLDTKENTEALVLKTITLKYETMTPEHQGTKDSDSQNQKMTTDKGLEL